MDDAGGPIGPETKVLDVVARYPAAQEVFRQWDAKAGECIMCKALFEGVGAVAERYGLDEAALLADLNEAAREPEK